MTALSLGLFAITCALLAIFCAINAHRLEMRAIAEERAEQHRRDVMHAANVQARWQG